jgi:hypothetical protein
MASVTAFAQQTITGTVRDNSGPVPGVNVAVKGTTRVTQTDTQGRYSVSAGPADVLVFTMVGSTRQEITVGTQQTINVTKISKEKKHYTMYFGISLMYMIYSFKTIQCNSNPW